MMTINWQWPSAIIFCVVTLVLGALIYTGKLPPETLGVIVAWLIPSPIKPNPVTTTTAKDPTP
jgi:hypothetical protein